MNCGHLYPETDTDPSSGLATDVSAGVHPLARWHLVWHGVVLGSMVFMRANRYEQKYNIKEII